MKKYFVMTDIHGFYYEMQKALTEAGFDIDNPDHIFVSLGDLLDRGPQPLMCLQFVNKLPEERKILIRGNHEDLMNDMLHHGVHSYDKSNGTVQTVRDLYGQTHGVYDNIYEGMTFVKNFDEWKNYYYSTKYYAVVGNYVFTHGWLPMYKDVMPVEKFMAIWEGLSNDAWKNEYTWQNGMKQWYNYGIIDGLTICCGHWHTAFGHSMYHGEDKEYAEQCYPFIDKGIIALDACTAINKRCNCVVLEI